MKGLSIALVLALSIGCAGSKPAPAPTTVIFSRAGGFSGLEERYMILPDKRIRKVTHFPEAAERIEVDTLLNHPALDSLHSYLKAHIDELSAMQLNEEGNMTTTVVLSTDHKTSVLKWPNLEPPVGSGPIVDTLYAKLLRIQEIVRPAR